MQTTKNFVITARATVNGISHTKTFGNFPDKKGFSQTLLEDLALDAFQKYFPGRKIDIKQVSIAPG